MHTRRTATAALGLALCLTAAGCGSDKKAESPSDAPSTASAPAVTATLTSDQVSSAVIKLADLGPGYKTIKANTDPAPGCLTPLDATINGFSSATSYAHADFAASSDAGIPEVSTLVNSFESASAAAKALSDLAAELADCTSVADTQDGATYDLTVTSNDDKATSQVDHQFNLDNTGEVSGPGGKFSVYIQYSFMQVGSAIVATGYSNTLTDTQAEAAKVAGLGLGRLLDVLAGTTPAPDPIDLQVFTGQLIP